MNYYKAIIYIPMRKKNFWYHIPWTFIKALKVLL